MPTTSLDHSPAAPPQRRSVARLFAYAWAAPTTALGLIAAALALLTRGRATIVDGVLEAHGGFVTFALRRLVPLQNGAAALTLGHVVLGQSAADLEMTRRHERVHVAQTERWGPLFLPAYFASSLVARLRGGDGYLDNRFEREAYAESNAPDRAAFVRKTDDNALA